MHYCTNLSLKLKLFSPLLSSEWQNKCVCTFYCIFNVRFFSPDGRKKNIKKQTKTEQTAEADVGKISQKDPSGIISVKRNNKESISSYSRAPFISHV